MDLPRRKSSQLEAMIARLMTQRARIEAAIRMVEALEGPVLEIGLGKGRTYSHLRQSCPGRDIIVFDRDLHAPPDATPPNDCLMLGDFLETLPMMVNLGGPQAVLAHADIGSDDDTADAALAREIAAPLVSLMAHQGLVVSDRAMPHPRLQEVDPPRFDLPSGIAPWPYFSYRVTAR